MINTGTQQNHVTVSKSTSEKEWTSYISSHADALIYHHPAWLKILESETGNEVIKLSAKDSLGNITGVLPLQITSGMFFGLGGLAGAPRVSSLPRTPLAGILADDEDSAAALISAAVDLIKNNPGKTLQIKTTDEILYRNKFLEIIPWRENFRITLPENENDIKFGGSRNHRRIRWAVNKAAAENVITRNADSESDLKKWYKLYLETSRWHAVPPRTFKFFKSLLESIPAELCTLLLAEKDGQILAGSFFLKFNKTVFYAFNGRDKDQLNLRPNDIIQYNSIIDSCRKGYLYYDMGEVARGQEGLVEFKKKWGCESRQIYHIYYSPEKNLSNGLMSDASGNLRLKLWRKLPVEMTEMLGGIINKRL